MRALFEQFEEEVRAQMREEAAGAPRDAEHESAWRNMVRELGPLGFTPEQIEEHWCKYRAHRKIQQEVIDRPEVFPGFAEVKGQEHMRRILDEGGAFLSWHFGLMRYNLEPILAELYRRQELGMNRPFVQVGSQAAVERESGLDEWVAMRQRCGIELLSSQDRMTGLKLFNHLKLGGAFTLFLDGQTGFNDDNRMIHTPFLSSTIKVRSGIFRILHRSKKPVCIVTTRYNEEYQPTITFHEPIQVFDPQAACVEVHRYFQSELIEHPEWWFAWYQHHPTVIAWHPSLEGTTPAATIQP